MGRKIRGHDVKFQVFFGAMAPFLIKKSIEVGFVPVLHSWCRT